MSSRDINANEIKYQQANDKMSNEERTKLEREIHQNNKVGISISVEP